MDNNVVFDPNKKDEKQAVRIEGGIPDKTTRTTPSIPPPQKMSGGFIKKILLVLVIIIVFAGIIFGALKLFGFLFSTISSPKTKLVYWGLWEPKNVMESVIKDFEKDNPNITVTYELRDIKDYRKTLLTRISNGTGPDIFRFHNSWTRSIKQNLSPLPASVIKPETISEAYFPVVKDDLLINGAFYGIPVHMDTLSMFVNTEILKESGEDIPKTWEDFIRVVIALTVKDEFGDIKTSGAAIGTYDNVNHAQDIISMLFAQNGVDLRNPAKTPSQVSEAIRFYTNFSSGRDALDSVWNSSKQNSLIEFTAGNVGIYFGYSWDIFDIKAKNPKLEFSVNPVPYLSKPTTIASYWVEGISSKSKNQKEAFKFLEFLSRKDVQQKLYQEQSKIRLFGELPARKDLGEMLKDNKLIYPFVLQAENAKSSYFVSSTYDGAMNEELNGYLGNAVRSVLENSSPQSSAETLLKGTDQVLTRYGVK